MRLAWASPMGPDSSIGRDTRLVLPLLRQHADVDVWQPPGPLCPDATHVLPRSPHVAQALQGYDAVFYLLGNHAPHHGAIWRASQAYPGIVVAHDINLHALVRRTPPEPGRPGYLELLERVYGPQVRQQAVDAGRGGRPDAPWAWPQVGRYPMLRPALVGARAVVVHSAWAEALVRAEFLGNVVVAPLPFAPVPAAGAPLDREALGLPPDRVVLLAVGHVQPNRHLGLLLSAVGGDARLRDRCTVVSAGAVSDGARADLSSKATAAGVDLRLLGQVAPDVLEGLLRHADVSVNLRHPHTESASGSLVEALASGLPVVRMRSGPHADVPEDTGAVVATTASPAELAAALVPLLDPATRAASGRSAAAFAQATHSPERYVARMLELARFPTSGAPTAALLRTVATAAREVGLPLEGRIGEVLAQTLLEVVGTPGADTGAPVLRR